MSLAYASEIAVIFGVLVIVSVWIIIAFMMPKKDKLIVRKRDYKLRPGSEISHVKVILEKSKTPLHINQIMDEMFKCINLTEEEWFRKRRSIAASIKWYARRNKVFKFYGKQTFGLSGDK